MSEEATTNPVDGGDTSELDTAGTETGVETEGQEHEPELDENGDPIDPPEDDSEEVEHDGQKYKVPKALKPLLLMQADYTRKTQQVAEERAVVQAERQALHQSSQAELDTYARATTLAGQLAQYQQVDWPAWHDSDPFAAAKATSEYQMLRDAHQQAIGQLSNLRGQRTLQQQQETAKRMEEGRAVLTREVPGWNDDLKAKLITHAAGYGFSRQELDDLEADPRVAKVLHAAFVGSTVTQAAKKVQSNLTAQAVTPAARVATARAPVTGLDDRLSAQDWVDRRNAQLRKKAGR